MPGEEGTAVNFNKDLHRDSSLSAGAAWTSHLQERREADESSEQTRDRLHTSTQMCLLINKPYWEASKCVVHTPGDGVKESGYLSDEADSNPCTGESLIACAKLFQAVGGVGQRSVGWGTVSSCWRAGAWHAVTTPWLTGWKQKERIVTEFALKKERRSKVVGASSFLPEWGWDWNTLQQHFLKQVLLNIIM